MSRFIIKGNNPIQGHLKPSGNKNAVLPMLAACLLTDDPVVLHNVPDIVDVRVMLELLASLGVTFEQANNTVKVCAKTITNHSCDQALCSRVRSSILLAGPLVARHGKAELYPPGGDVIGKRRLDTHFYGLESLGVSISDGDFFSFKRTKALRGVDLLLDEASVTATENIMMAAVLAKGTTTIFNAACEPHVQDLAQMLNSMGARIENFGTNRIRVHGVEQLHGVEHTVTPDYIEVGSYMAAAAATGGELTIEGVDDPMIARVIKRSFGRLGVSWSIKKDKLVLPANQTLDIKKDYGNTIPKIEDGIWPSFPSDLMSVAIVLATQATGTILFFEKLFESRMYFVDRLIEMGAQIIQCDPHRVVVSGPAQLHGTHITSPDIRAGMALIIAALCAKGTSVIESAQMIDRGYERIDERLRDMGADIERTD